MYLMMYLILFIGVSSNWFNDFASFHKELLRGKYNMLYGIIFGVIGQSRSSDPSVQSASPSHFHVLDTQVPSLHLNHLAGSQFRALTKELTVAINRNINKTMLDLLHILFESDFSR